MKNTLIGLVVFGFCTIVCILIGFVFKTSLTVLGHVHTSKYSIQATSKNLEKGDTVKIQLVALEDNLGAISLSIKNYNTNEKKDDHRLLFRIKDLKGTTPIAEHTYYGGQFHDLDHFPFGFGPIPDSKGKTYVAEIISLDGTKNSKLTLNTSYPSLISYYQFDKRNLFTLRNLSSFVTKKVLFSLSFPDFAFIVFICYLPFFFYLFTLSSVGKVLSKVLVRNISLYGSRYRLSYVKKILEEMYVNTAVIPLVIVVVSDVFLIKSNYIFVTYVVMSIFTFCLLIKKTTVKFLMKFGFSLLVLAVIISLFDKVDAAEKLVGWAIWVLLISTIYEIIWKKNTT